MNHKFWLVWNEQHGAPTFKHMMRQDAKNEAERLARQHRGHSFHVLEVLGTVTVSDVTWFEHDPHNDGIPF